MTAEEIYPLIEDNDASQTLDKHAYDHDNQGWGSDDGLREDDLTDRPSAADSRDGEQSGDTQTRSEPESGDGGTAEPEPLTPNEQETLNVQWQQRMAGAAQQAMQAGKLGGELERMIDHLLQPQLPWRMLLARYMTAAARDDYSYMRPSRREGDFILPTLRSHQLELVVAVDTSGSIKERELAEFIAEINALKGQVRARVTLLPCDTRLCEGAPWVFEPWEGSSHLPMRSGAAAPAFYPCSTGSNAPIRSPIWWSTSPTPRVPSHPKRRTIPSSGWSRVVRGYPVASYQLPVAGFRQWRNHTNRKDAKDAEILMIHRLRRFSQSVSVLIRLRSCVVCGRRPSFGCWSGQRSVPQGW